MKNKYIKAVEILFLVMICIFAAGWFQKRTEELNYIEHIYMNGNYLYHVDRGDDNVFRIVRSDMKGEHGTVIECSRHEKGKYRSISQLFFDDKGNAYILIKETDTISLQEKNSNIYLCDFESGKLINSGFDFIDVVDDSNEFRVQKIQNRKLYYFGIVSNEEFQGVKIYTIDESRVIEQIDAIHLDAPYLWSQFFLSDNNRILWMDNSGEIFVKELETEEYLNIEGITGVKGKFKSLSNDGKNTVFFLDYQEECMRKIDLSNLTAEVVCTEVEVAAKEEEFKFEDLTNLNGIDTGFYSGVQGETHSDFTAICIYRNGKHVDIDHIKLTAKDTIRILFQEYYWVLLVFAIVVLYWWYCCKYKRHTILVPIILIFAVGLLLMDYVFQNWVEKSIREQSEKEQLLALSVIGEQVDNQIINSMENNPEQLISNSVGLSLRKVEKNEKYQQPMVYTYSIIRADDQGKLLIQESMTEYSNVPIERYYSAESAEAMYESYRTGKDITFSSEEYSSLFSPLILKNGTIYGLLAISFSSDILEYQLWVYQWNLRAISIAIMAVIIVILIFVITIFLRPLKKLKVCAGRLASGELGVTVPVHGHDEVAEIAEAFNQMSLGIKNQVNDIQEISDGYYKFIPSKILKLLGKESIKEVRLGDHFSTKMSILTLYTENYLKQRPGLTREKVYEVMNTILSHVVAPITDHHGVVEHFEDSGLSAFFTEGSQEALDAAIEIHHSFAKANMKYKKSIAITYGDVMIGVIGYENRMEATTVSAHSDMAKILRYKGEKYGARILITNLVYHQIPDFENNYHARYLGNVYLSATDTIERIYDVYDGDTEEEFYYKELTKPLFEKGVELFVAKKFYEARLVFVEVLKQHRKDRAAKEYLYLCDRYYKFSDMKEADTMLERF